LFSTWSTISAGRLRKVITESQVRLTALRSTIIRVTITTTKDKLFY